MRLRTAAEDAEATKVEVEQIGRRIDASQGAIELEVIALILLDEAPRDDYLEHVVAQTMLYATANVGLVLIVGERRSNLANGMESVGLHISSVHLPGDKVDS